MSHILRTYMEFPVIVEFEVDWADPSVGITNTETEVSSIMIGDIDVTGAASDTEKEDLVERYWEARHSEIEGRKEDDYARLGE